MKIRTFISGFLAGSIFFSGLAYGAVKMEMVEVSRNTINLIVNDEKVNSDNFIFEGRTYIQMREIAEMLGKEVGWDGDTRTASINEKKPQVVTDKEVSINERIVVEDFCEATIKSAKFTDVVKPSVKGETYYSYYEVKDKNNIYLDLIVEIKSLQEESKVVKSIFSTERFADIEIVYKDKYKYDSFQIVESKDGKDFESADSSYIKPLTSETIHFIAEIPKEVKDTDNHVKAILKIKEHTYLYNIK